MENENLRHEEKARIFSRRPPAYGGGDDYLRQENEYLHYMVRELEHRLGLMLKRIEKLEG